MSLTTASCSCSRGIGYWREIQEAAVVLLSERRFKFSPSSALCGDISKFPLVDAGLDCLGGAATSCFEDEAKADVETLMWRH